MSAPLHERIRQEIEAQILSGALAPGARLPTEQDLMARHGCARMTVSKALSALAAAGLIDRRKRAGSFVARPKMHSMVLDIPDLAAEVARRGQAYRFDLIEREIAQGADGERLGLLGVHHADGRPLAVERRSIRLAAVPEARDADFQAVPPGTWLLRHVPWTQAELRLAAVPAEGEVAALLDVPAGTPALLVARRTWRGSEGITRVRLHFPGTDYDLVARFGPGHAP